MKIERRIFILLLLVCLVMGKPHWDDCGELCYDCTFRFPNGCLDCDNCRRAQNGEFLGPQELPYEP